MRVRFINIEGENVCLLEFDSKQAFMLLLTGIRRYAHTLPFEKLKQEILRNTDLLEGRMDSSLAEDLYETAGTLPASAASSFLQALFMSTAMSNL